MKKEEYKPLKQIEQGLTTCKIHNQFTGMIDACCVRSAVTGLKYDLCCCDDNFDEMCEFCDKIKKWFPVLFQEKDEEVSGR